MIPMPLTSSRSSLLAGSGSGGRARLISRSEPKLASPSSPSSSYSIPAAQQQLHELQQKRKLQKSLRKKDRNREGRKDEGGGGEEEEKRKPKRLLHSWQLDFGGFRHHRSTDYLAAVVQESEKRIGESELSRSKRHRACGVQATLSVDSCPPNFDRPVSCWHIPASSQQHRSHLRHSWAWSLFSSSRPSSPNTRSVGISASVDDVFNPPKRRSWFSSLAWFTRSEETLRKRSSTLYSPKGSCTEIQVEEITDLSSVSAMSLPTSPSPRTQPPPAQISSAPSSKKFKERPLSQLLRKLSPGGSNRKEKAKSWVVVEFAQNSIEGGGNHRAQQETPTCNSKKESHKKDSMLSALSPRKVLKEMSESIKKGSASSSQAPLQEVRVKIIGPDESPAKSRPDESPAKSRPDESPAKSQERRDGDPARLKEGKKIKERKENEEGKLAASAVDMPSQVPLKPGDTRSGRPVSLEICRVQGQEEERKRADSKSKGKGGSASARGHQMEVLASKMASIESIGTCSLEAETTDGEASERSSTDALASAASHQALKSLSIDLASHGSGALIHSQGSLRRRVGSVEILEERTPPSPSAWKPSYVHLSCSVSGYSEVTRYNSKLREGWRSRDNSPARITLLLRRSQDSESLKSPNLVISSHNPRGASTSQSKEMLSSPFKVREIQRQQAVNGSSRFVAQNRSVSADRGQARRWFYVENEIPIDDTPCERQSRPTRRNMLNNGPQVNGNHGPNGKAIPNGNGVNGSGESENEYSEVIASGQSFIQQRIERLYGPGSGAQLCKLNRRKSQAEEQLGLDKENVLPFQNGKEENGDEQPAVFRHLRQEFREQLPAKKPSLTGSPPVTSPEKTTASPVAKKVQKLSSIENVVQPSSSSLPVSSSSPPPSSSSSSAEEGSKLLEDSDIAIAPPLFPSVSPEKKTTEVKDGQYFMKALEEQRHQIEEVMSKAEADLASGQVPEDVCGSIRVAIGKAGLLCEQKFSQFHGLCLQNMNPSEGNTKVTAEDLAGFWDLVGIQVADIHETFARIDLLRQNGWIEKTTSPVKEKSAGKKGQGGARKKTSTSTQKSQKEKERDEERRRRLQEAKKRMQVQSKVNSDSNLQIYCQSQSPPSSDDV